MDFQTKDVFFCPLLKSEITIAEHGQTGTPWIHLRDSSGLNFTGLSVRTPSFDHSGIAHACEHLVGAGSKSNPSDQPFLSALHHPNTLFLNNFTLPDHTIFCLLQKGGRSDSELLATFLDGIFNPLLREESFSREIVSKTGKSGALLNEMRMRSTDPRYIRQKHLLSQFFPASSFAFDFVGDPMAIGRLTLSDVTHFHQTNYQLQNMLLFTSAEDDGSQFVNTLSDLICGVRASALSQARLSPKPQQTVGLSMTVHTSHWPVNAGPELTLSYAIDLPSEAKQTADLAVFETAFFRGPQSPIRAMLAGLECFGGVRNPFGIMREIYWPIIAISAKANVSERTASIFEEEFAHAVSSHANAPLVAVSARRALLDLTVGVDWSKTDRAMMLFRRCAQSHAVGKDATSAIRLAEQKVRLAQIQRSPEILFSEMRTWFGPRRTGAILLGSTTPSARPSHPAKIKTALNDALMTASLPSRSGALRLPVRSSISRGDADSPCRVQIGFQNEQLPPADALWIVLATTSLAKVSGSTNLRHVSDLLHCGLTSETRVFAKPEGRLTLWSAWEWKTLQDDLGPSLAVFSRQLNSLSCSDNRALAIAARQAVKSLHYRLETAPLELLQLRSRAGVSSCGAATEAITGLSALPALEAVTQQLLSDDPSAMLAQARNAFARTFTRQSFCAMIATATRDQIETERQLEAFSETLSDANWNEQFDDNKPQTLSSHAYIQTRSNVSSVAMSYALPEQHAVLAKALSESVVPAIRASGVVYDAKTTYCRKSQVVTISTVGDSRPEQSLQIVLDSLTDELAHRALTISTHLDPPDLTERLQQKFGKSKKIDHSDSAILKAQVREMQTGVPSIAYCGATPNESLAQMLETSADVVSLRS